MWVHGVNHCEYIVYIITVLWSCSIVTIVSQSYSIEQSSNIKTVSSVYPACDRFPTGQPVISELLGQEFALPTAETPLCSWYVTVTSYNITDHWPKVYLMSTAGLR